MQVIITDAWLAKSRAIHLSGRKLLAAGLLAAFLLTVVGAALYDWVFLKSAHKAWAAVANLVQQQGKEDGTPPDRFVRENIDVMARKLGELQAKLMQLESLGERVSGLAGVVPANVKTPPGRGGVLIEGRSLTIEELQSVMASLDELTNRKVDLMTVLESKLFDQKIRNMMIPTQHPVESGNMGSAFGWRIDPITGRSALHTGLDFQADTGVPILAAAGGVVVTQEYNAGYGNMIEIDHGNELISRYAHASQVFVKKGALVKRGQKIAEVGTTGRSTGAHLHFEVLVQGVPQDPQKFLNAGSLLPKPQLAKADLNAKVALK